MLVEQITHQYPKRKPPRGRARRQPAADATEKAVRPALDAVDLCIEPGEVFGILGPNGGGKTTLFRILSTLMRPTQGSARVFGHDVVADSDAVRRCMGVVFQNPSLDGKLTARENLMHQGHLYGLSGRTLDQRIMQQLSQFDLADRADDATETFSGGMRRRCELAKALLHEPRLLLLDEPSTGLDPGARRDMWQALETLRRERGVTIALTTHLMEEADRCDRLALISRGRVVAVDTPAALKSQIGGDVITIEPLLDAAREGDTADALAADIEQQFGPWDEGASPAVVDGRVIMEKDDGATFIATLTTALPGRYQSITVGRPTLEDVFTHFTGQRLGEDDAVAELG